MSQHSVKFEEAKRHAVYLRDGYKCAYTGQVDTTYTGVGLSIDHIKARASGGAPQNTKLSPGTNLITSSASANYAKQDKTPAQWTAYLAANEPPKGGLTVDFKDIRKQARQRLDLRRGEQLADLAREAREARGPHGEETKKSRAIAAKSAAIVASYQAEQKAKAEKKAGPGVRHDPKDGRFQPGNESRRYALRTGEPLAISADAIRRDADGFFVMSGGSPPPNDARGTVAIVNVRGALQHWACEWGDSYEGLVARVAEALASYPSSVLLRIDSPGGVVAGLNECVIRLQRMSREAKIPLVAYIDELAASAAYALCCACERILCPPSGIAGSVGVISTMVSMAARDEREGVAFRIITSGKRKADGHLHVPITEDAVRAETARNNELAAQFFALASKARRRPAARLEGLQAAIYLGRDAKRVGLVDEVVGLDDALLGLDRSAVGGAPRPAPNEGNITDRRARELRADVSRLLKAGGGLPRA
jgi:ClpP class serine protease